MAVQLQLFLYFSQQLRDFLTPLKLFLGFSQQLQKCANIQMFSTPSLSLTSLGLSFFLNHYDFMFLSLPITSYVFACVDEYCPQFQFDVFLCELKLLAQHK